MLCGYDRRKAANFALCGERIKSSGACPKNQSTAHKHNMRAITKGEKFEKNESHSHRR